MGVITDVGTTSGVILIGVPPLPPVVVIPPEVLEEALLPPLDELDELDELEEDEDEPPDVLDELELPIDPVLLVLPEEVVETVDPLLNTIWMAEVAGISYSRLFPETDTVANLRRVALVASNP